jgi:tetratricopeptide (TPR) repeat protein
MGSEWPSLRLLAVAAALAAPAAVAAQTTASIAAGDSAHAARDAGAALTLYERVLGDDSANYEASWKASRSAADLAEATERVARTQLLASAERHARRAVAIRPPDAEGHFAIARALGLAARSVGVRERVRYAMEIRDRALTCLRYSPQHPGCLHVLGAWNREVMQLSGLERFVAQRVLGGRVLAEASWDDAIANLEGAVAVEPWRIVHRLELGTIYRAVGRIGYARRELESAIDLPVRDYNDPTYKALARRELRRLR